MQTDPLTLVRTAIEAVKREDWNAAAALCDPVSLVAFRRGLIEQFGPSAPRHELTVEELLRFEAAMPREVAEYQVAQHRVHADPARRLREELPGISNFESLEALGPEAVFAAWLDGRGPRRQIERLAATGQISPEAVAHSDEIVAGAYQYEVVGVVPDGERLAHVLYRLAIDRSSPDDEEAEWLRQRSPEEQELARDLSGRTHPQVVTCRRQPDGSWRMLAGYDFLGMVNTSISISESPENPTTATDNEAE